MRSQTNSPDTLLTVRTLPFPQNVIVGAFLVLAAAAFAAAPFDLSLRSVGILLVTYLAFSVAGSPFAYLSALIAPPVGLIGGDPNWLIMLPIIMSSTLLGVLGLEYAWRYPALIISPLLAAAPHFVAARLAEQSLFSIALPWLNPSSWLWLHALGALGGVLVCIFFDRRRERLGG